MANYVGRRAGWSGLFVVVLAGVMSAVPVGAGAVEPGDGRLPAGLVAAIERDLGMDVGEYLRRTDSAQRTTVEGGDRFATDTGNACSWAFNAVDGEGNPVALTAGHCDAATDKDAQAAGEGRTFEVTPAVKAGAQTGVFEKSVMDGVRDYSIVRIIDEARESFHNNLIRADGESIAITGVGIPVVGEPVCKSGATTGYTCGVILAVDQPDPRRPPIRFTHTALSLPGDSGGAIFSGTLALGIVSRGGYTDDPNQFPTDKPDPVHTPPLPAPLDQIGKRLLAGDGRQTFEQLAPLIDAIMRAHPQLTMIAQSVADVLAENPGLQIRTR